jgi:hypothetical protein
MRTLADHIGSKYDAKFPGGGRIPTSAFNGVPFKSISDIARVVVGMFKSYYPSIFDSYIEHQIKNRPFGTKLIYFVGDFLQTGPFDRNGIERIEAKDVDSFMGRKDKKAPKKAEPSKTSELSDS